MPPDELNEEWQKQCEDEERELEAEEKARYKMTELKPCPKCPICGNEMDVVHNSANHTHEIFHKYGNFYLACWGCDLLFGYDIDYEGQFLTIEEAIEAWNRRAE